MDLTMMGFSDESSSFSSEEHDTIILGHVRLKQGDESASSVRPADYHPYHPRSSRGGKAKRPLERSKL